MTLTYAGRVTIMGAALLWAVGTDAAEDRAARLVAESKAPARYSGHRADFQVATESFEFVADGKTDARTFRTIRDAGRYVAVLDESMGQLDMITFDPSKAPVRPPFAPDRYTWATLLGTRITVTPWYGDMRSTSDDRKLVFSGGGESLTLTNTETWRTGRRATSEYVMTLRCDPVLGYVWDISTRLATSVGTNAKGEAERVEFFNWQVKTTHMGRRHDKSWPDAWTHERTVFYREDDRLVGFYMNPEANDRSKFKRTPVKEGGYVAMLPGPDGWGVALAHLDKGGAGCNNATCNMWADQHNYLQFPAKPDAEGMYRVAARWRFQALPPEAVAVILKQVEMDDLGHTLKP